MFRKEDFFKEYPFRCELHAHTSPVSNCSEITAEQLIESYHRLGCNVLVLTNHFLKDLFHFNDIDSAIDYYLKDFENAKAIGAQVGIKVLLGSEIRFTENQNDYLIYGVDRTLLRKAYEWLDKGIEAFSKEFRTDSTIIIQAHPFRDNMTKVNPELLDGIEAANMHPNHNSRIGFSILYAKEHPSFLMTAGTDYHHYNHEGMAFLRLKKVPQDSYELVQILRSKDYVFEIGQSSILIP